MTSSETANDILHQTVADLCEVEKGQVVTGGLFVAGGEGAEAVEVMEKQLYVEELSIQFARERATAGFR